MSDPSCGQTGRGGGFFGEHQISRLLGLIADAETCTNGGLWCSNQQLRSDHIRGLVPFEHASRSFDRRIPILCARSNAKLGNKNRWGQTTTPDLFITADIVAQLWKQASNSFCRVICDDAVKDQPHRSLKLVGIFQHRVRTRFNCYWTRFEMKQSTNGVDEDDEYASESSC